MREIDAAVIEIEGPELRAVRAVLSLMSEVQSVAQLGQRLHALVDRTAAEPEARLARALDAAGVAARVTLSRASLEDVFVAATRGRRESELRA